MAERGQKTIHRDRIRPRNDILAKIARARKALDATQGAEATEARRERKKA